MLQSSDLKFVYGKGVVFAFMNVDWGLILSEGTIAKRLI
jgi:hypothetical protein